MTSFQKRLLASVASISLFAGSASAADLGGNCCADLEERVAELEATAAKKGNRKMSLTVYGQVNVGILHVTGDGESETTITTNPNSQTRFGMKGEAKIGNSAKAGYLLEIGIGKANYTGKMTDDLVLRHSAVYLESDQLGAVWLGKTSTATDGIAEISIAKVNNASTLLSLEPLSGTYLGGLNLPFDGSRAEVMKYVSPTFAGFQVSASWMANADDGWDAALRYAGEFGGFRVAAGIGYRDDQLFDSQTVAGSASVMHVGTGLFVNAAAADTDNAVLSFMGTSFPTGVELRAAHVQGGIERNWFGFGSTTLYAEWGRLDIQSFATETDMWGLGMNQSIDAAAMDLYVGYRKYDDLDIQSVIAGGVVRF